MAAVVVLARVVILPLQRTRHDQAAVVINAGSRYARWELLAGAWRVTSRHDRSA